MFKQKLVFAVQQINCREVQRASLGELLGPPPLVTKAFQNTFNKLVHTLQILLRKQEYRQLVRLNGSVLLIELFHLSVYVSKSPYAECSQDSSDH